MKKSSKIFVAGSRGLVGSAITRVLQEEGYKKLLLPSRKELDLLDYNAVDAFFENEKPEYVFLAAAKVGGIVANNTYRADFIYQNIQIQNNIIHSAWKHGVEKLLFLGSSCIYPKESPQPMKEEYLLTGPLEYTNEPYAIAKIAGMNMCESFNQQYGTDFISVMPTNLYGENDNYNLETSHVLPALIRKMHLAQALLDEDFDAIRHDMIKRPIDGVQTFLGNKELTKLLERYGIFEVNGTVELKLWGSGQPRREFLHSQDLAQAAIHLMKNVSFNDIVEERGLSEIRNTHINIGSGKDLSIAELAEKVQKIVGFEGIITWDDSKPDGTYQKLLDISRIKKLGWKPSISLKKGIGQVYHQYLIE